MHLSGFASSGRDVPIPVEAPTLTQGWVKQVKCLIQVVYRKKRLVVMKEMLFTRLPWGEGTHLSGEAFASAVPIWCSSCLLSFALSEPCPSPLHVRTQSEMLSWL